MRNLHLILLRGLFEHERLNPVTIRTSHSNINSWGSIEAIVDLRYGYIGKES